MSRGRGAWRALALAGALAIDPAAALSIDPETGPVALPRASPGAGYLDPALSEADLLVWPGDLSGAGATGQGRRSDRDGGADVMALLDPWEALASGDLAPSRHEGREAQAVWHDPKEIARALYEGLLANPYGAELLRVSLEVLAPFIDSAGRLHLSLFGPGAPATTEAYQPPPDDLQVGRDPFLDERFRATLSSGALTPHPVGAPPPLDVPPSLWALGIQILASLAAVLTHPLTLTLALLGGVGYLLVRYALETRRRRARHGHGTRRHRTSHHLHSRRHRTSRRTRVPRSP